MSADLQETPDRSGDATPPTPPLPGLPDDLTRPLEEQLPPEIVATPSHVQELPGQDIMWWRPGWHDVWQYVGYRWIFLIPAIGLLVMFGMALYMPFLLGPLAVLGVKLFIFMAAVFLSLAGYVIRRAVRARKEPFCIYCGYNLSGLPDNYRCPECGRPYTWQLIAEYRRDPHWFIDRYKAHRRLPPADEPFAAGPVVRRRTRDGT